MDRDITITGSESTAPGPSQPGPRPRSSRLRRVVSVLLLLSSAGAVTAWWIWSLYHVSTNNAYVVANITPVSSEISGKVVVLYTDDNMLVKAGDPLAQLDPVPLQLEVDQALADWRQLEAQARSAEVNVRLVKQDRKALLEAARGRLGEADRARHAAKAEVASREQIHAQERELLASRKAQMPGLLALERNARDYFGRFSRLASSGDVPVQDRDNREATYHDAAAKVESLRSDIAADERRVGSSQLQLQVARAQLEQSEQKVKTEQGAVAQAEAAQLQPGIATADLEAVERKVLQAEARLAAARINLSYCLIRAPQGGIVSRRTIQLGEILAAKQPFLSIVPLTLDDVWVVANLREDQINRVRVGNPAEISLDGVPDRKFHGWVESVSGGTGSVFSLFPPDNATGNFVRVVQRLPVRVRFSEPDNYQNRIRPGMSANVRIDDSRVVRSSDRIW